MATSLGDWQGREAHSSQGLIVSELVAKSQEEEEKRREGAERQTCDVAKLVIKLGQ